MNHFKKMGRALNAKGIRTLPGRYMSKAALLKGWQRFFEEPPVQAEIEQWEELQEANVDILLGQCSNIVALDFDCEDQEIIDFLNEMDILPRSPVEKVGSKGFTRFFKYKGESTEQLSFNGKVVFEILSDGKKTTMGTHPNGSDYKWTTEKTLLDDIELPVLPPALVQSVELMIKNKFGGSETSSYGKVINGRNDALTNYLTTMINGNHTVDEAVLGLIKFDKENSETPLFDDPNENRHTEPYTNALQFYVNHVNSYNYKRMRDNKKYIVPIMESVTKLEEQKEREVGKSISKGSQKKLKQDFLRVPSVLKNVQETILKNSWIRQPELAFGASLALMATLTSRKFIYQGISPNLYILNISHSGSGKDMPMKFVKNTLAKINATDLLGAGDYVSDASLMDSLPNKNVRLDVMDEVGGILRSINKGRSEYNSKMADILAELYTSSNGYYMGRAVASGMSGTELNVKGACYRPNVNILGSTTPTGFEEGVSKTAIDKGLLGRFLMFTGEGTQKSTRVKTERELDSVDMDHLRWLHTYTPNESGIMINNIDQRCTQLNATESADKRLDEIFNEFDNKRIKRLGTAEGPIVARLYQQMIKLVIIHAASRYYKKIPTIDLCDVEFGYSVINEFSNEITLIVQSLIFNTPEEKNRAKVLNVIRKSFNITKKDIVLATPGLSKRNRDIILEELEEAGKLNLSVEKINDKKEIIYAASNN